MEMLDNKKRKARKDHKCSFCRGIIKKGDYYIWSKIVDNRELYEWKSHLICDQLVSILNMDCGDDGLTSDQFCDYIHDEYLYMFGFTPEDPDIEKMIKEISE